MDCTCPGVVTAAGVSQSPKATLLAPLSWVIEYTRAALALPARVMGLAGTGSCWVS